MRIHTVVDVMSGVAIGMETFLNAKDAKMCLRRLRKGRDLNEDDVQLFEAVIDMSRVRRSVPRKSPRKARG